MSSFLIEFMIASCPSTLLNGSICQYYGFIKNTMLDPLLLFHNHFNYYIFDYACLQNY